MRASEKKKIAVNGPEKLHITATFAPVRLESNREVTYRNAHDTRTPGTDNSKLSERTRE